MLHKMTERITVLETAEIENKEQLAKQGAMIAEHYAASNARFDEHEKRFGELNTKVQSLTEQVAEQSDIIGDHTKELEIAAGQWRVLFWGGSGT
jgi:chromosome segregation ATPase